MNSVARWELYDQYLKDIRPTPEQIDACSDIATVERWLDEAVTAASADEALA